MTAPPAHATRRRRLTTAGLGLALALLVTSCALLPPVGTAPLRYRDAVFSDFTKVAGIPYATAVNEQGDIQTLTLDTYSPTGDTNTSRPLIIWAHGGSFRFGNSTSPEIVDQATTFARKGYVNASINYRLSSVGCTPPTAACLDAVNDAVADAQSAVRFFRAHAAEYGIDPTRIAIGGTSAGAIMALDVGYQLGAPTNGSNPGFSSSVRAAVSLSGAVLFNGIVSADDAPALLFHGTADPLVPYAWAKSTSDAARAANVSAYLISWEGDGHVPYVQHRSQILDLTSNFLYNTLDAAHAA